MKGLEIPVFIAVVLSLILIFYAPVFVNEDGTVMTSYMEPANSDEEYALELFGDKEIYRSSEEMRLNAVAGSSETGENVTLRIYGIKDSRGNLRVSEERNVTIGSNGLNETFNFRMPSCYGCAGVSPGEYEIVMEVWKSGELAGNCSKTVTLEK